MSEKKSHLSKKTIDRKKGAQALPKRKRGAPHGTPGIPGRGDISTYHATLESCFVWITNASEVADLSTRGSFGKGILSRSVPDFEARSRRNVAAQQRLVKKLKFQNSQSTTATDNDNNNANSATSSTTSSTTIQNNDNNVELINAENQLQRNATSIVGDNGEALQLSFEETFFLHFALNCLEVRIITNDNQNDVNNTNNNNNSLSSQQLWNKFCELDERFRDNYIAYHYYRSKCWCPKPGLKFGADWILYKKGPQYHHASYQVIVCSVDREEFIANDSDTSRWMSWTKIHHLGRLAEGVQKELLLCYVVAPKKGTDLTLVTSIKQFSVREIALKRWLPSAEEKSEAPNAIKET